MVVQRLRRLGHIVRVEAHLAELADQAFLTAVLLCARRTAKNGDRIKRGTENILIAPLCLALGGKPFGRATPLGASLILVQRRNTLVKLG